MVLPSGRRPIPACPRGTSRLPTTRNSPRASFRHIVTFAPAVLPRAPEPDMTQLTAHTRKYLAQSLPLVEAQRPRLLERMEEYLRACEEPGEDYGQAEISAMVLVDLLLAKTREIVEQGTARDLSAIIAQHRLLDIDGRHYSRFGDALVAILKDLLGASVPSAIPAAWCDAFWAVIHAADRKRNLVTA